MSENAGNNWRDPAFKIADIVMRYNEWRKDYYMPPPSAWLDELLGECVRLRAEVERLRLTDAERETLQAVRDIYESHDDDDECARIAAVVDALLARLGGAS